MKMIAIGTVHGSKLVKAADPKDPRSRPRYQDVIARPGEEFDTDELGIDEAESADLVARKAARRKTKEIPDDGAPVQGGAVAAGGATG